MATQRQLKYGKMIMEELAAIFIKELSNDFAGALVTLSEVQVSPDLKVAKVYFTVMPDGKEGEIAARLEAKTGYIRNLLGRKIRHQVRAIPALHFHYDDRLREAARINKLIDDLDIPDQDQDQEEE